MRIVDITDIPANTTNITNTPNTTNVLNTTTTTTPSDSGSTTTTEAKIIQTSGIEEQLDYLTENIPGLSKEQAKVLLEGAYDKDSSVVFGGSRVRGNYTEQSDLDVGFGSLTKNQASKLLNKAGKVEDGLNLEQTKIIPGNETPTISIIKSPEEFFQRSGDRFFIDNGEKIFTTNSKGESTYGPSGSITVTPDGQIKIIPPGGKID